MLKPPEMSLLSDASLFFAAVPVSTKILYTIRFVFCTLYFLELSKIKLKKLGDWDPKLFSFCQTNADQSKTLLKPGNVFVMRQ